MTDDYHESSGVRPVRPATWSGAPLIQMKPMHLHVNQKPNDDDGLYFFKTTCFKLNPCCFFNIVENLKIFVNLK